LLLVALIVSRSLVAIRAAEAGSVSVQTNHGTASRDGEDQMKTSALQPGLCDTGLILSEGGDLRGDKLSQAIEKALAKKKVELKGH